MDNIVALQDTVLKKSWKDSSELNESDVHYVEKNQKWRIVNYKEEINDHTLVSLEHGGGSWYIYNPHWDCSWLDDHENESNLIKEVDAKDGFIIPKTIHDVDWNNFDSPISKYFVVGEVVQWETRRIPEADHIKENILEFAQINLDDERDKWGSPLQVTSWYRPWDVNMAVGGASNSRHLYGDAADIFPSNGQIWKLQQRLDEGAWKNRALGYGAPDFVHLDNRQKRIRWNY
jgi:hypothetical protein